MAEEQAPQTTAEVQPQTQQQDPQISNKFAALAKREKFLRSQAEKIKAEKAEWETKYQTKEQEYQKAMELQKSLDEDPIKTLIRRGKTPQQIAEMLLQLDQPQYQETKIDLVKQELKSDFESQLKKMEADRALQQQEQVKKQIQNEVKMLVDSDPEAYESIKGTGSEDAVADLIEMTYNEDGVLLSAEDAAKEVEEYLIEEAIKLASFSKIKSRLNPVVEQKTEIPKTQGTRIVEKSYAQSTPKTLTQAVTTSSGKPMSAKERAILAFQGKLK